VRSAFFVLTLSVTLLSVGCAERRSWEEDLQLSDGRRATVERIQIWTRADGIGEPKSYRTKRTKFELRADQLDDAIHWEAEREKPLILDYDAAAQEFFLITIPTDCGFWVNAGRPRPAAYLEYRYRSGRWVRVPLPADHLELSTNLLIVGTLEEIPAHVSNEVRQRRNRQYAVPGHAAEYLSRIMRGGQVFGCR